MTGSSVINQAMRQRTQLAVHGYQHQYQAAAKASQCGAVGLRARKAERLERGVGEERAVELEERVDGVDFNGFEYSVS